ncbi:MAG: transporter [Aquaticitalea sp.]
MKYSVLLVILITFNGYSQGKIDGFYRGQGKGTAVLGFGFEDSKKYFAGRTKINLSRNLFYANLYSAYGITNNLDAQVSIPYLISDDNMNLQDISLFVKYRFYKKQIENGNFQMSFGAGFSTPLSDYAIGDLNDLGQQATIIETRAMLHYQSNSNWFGTLQSGFSFKLEEVPNSFPFALKVGKASEKWYYDVYYEYQYSFGGTDYLGSPRPQNFKEFGVDYHKVGGTIFRPISKNLGAYVSISYLLKGRNSFQGAAYGLGLSYDFRTAK